MDLESASKYSIGLDAICRLNVYFLVYTDWGWEMGWSANTALGGEKMENNRPVVFLSGKKVNLRPYDKKRDLENCIQWINDPEVRWWIESQLPITLEKEEEILEKVMKDSSTIFLVIETKEGKPIGVMSLVHINWISRTASTGAFIGEKEYWSKGFGTDAKMMLLDYAFHTLNLRKITSTVVAFNKRSIAYNMKCGYKVEGRRQKQWYRGGKYQDEVLLAVWRKDFERVYARYLKGS